MIRRHASGTRPLNQAVTARISSWLPKLEHPIRTGEHNKTALGMCLMLDYARITGDAEFGQGMLPRRRAGRVIQMFPTRSVLSQESVLSCDRAGEELERIMSRRSILGVEK
jgi:hypothetical protein